MAIQKSKSDQIFGPRENLNPQFKFGLLIFTTFVAFQKKYGSSEGDEVSGFSAFSQ